MFPKHSGPTFRCLQFAFLVHHTLGSKSRANVQVNVEGRDSNFCVRVAILILRFHSTVVTLSRANVQVNDK